MEQRRLRLGDILDDYCPRERRVTNHAVVAMVEDDVKQTRCTTCDAEHVYKGGKTPRRKKSESTGKLYKQVLAGLTDDPARADVAASVEQDVPDVIDEGDSNPEPVVVAAIVDETPVMDDDIIEDAEPQPPFDDGPVHRPLIRAQLPRLDGVKPERQAPDFTMRHAGRGNFRGQGQNAGQRFGRGGPHRGNGNGHGRGPQFGRAGHGQRNKRGR